MKITKLKTTKLAIKNKSIYHYSLGALKGTNTILVEIETDEGIYGVGEVTGGQNVEALDIFLKTSEPLLIGESPFDIERFLDRFNRHQKLTRLLPFANNLSCGIEMALWDIVGKASNQPVHKLLGGKFHNSIDFFGFVQGRDPEEMGDYASQLYNEGFKVIYYKIGYSEKEDLEITRKLRIKLGEQALLRPDVNELYSEGEAKRLLLQMADYQIDWVEQPLGVYNIDGMSLLRTMIPMRLAIDQGANTLEEINRAIHAKAADVYVVGFHETGGILGLKKAGAMLQAANLPLNRHGILGETGISTLAALQVLATIPNITDGNQVMHQLLEEDIVVDGLLTFNEGKILVPETPGLGIELDRDRVDKYAREYKKFGQYSVNPVHCD
tara:strand:- start:109 stop:1257 length:1149 start_codon:yes stop_codon:yes gene_type:complete